MDPTKHECIDLYKLTLPVKTKGDEKVRKQAPTKFQTKRNWFSHFPPSLYRASFRVMRRPMADKAIATLGTEIAYSRHLISVAFQVKTAMS